MRVLTQASIVYSCRTAPPTRPYRRPTSSALYRRRPSATDRDKRRPTSPYSIKLYSLTEMQRHSNTMHWSGMSLWWPASSNGQRTMTRGNVNSSIYSPWCPSGHCPNTKTHSPSNVSGDPRRPIYASFRSRRYRSVGPWANDRSFQLTDFSLSRSLQLLCIFNRHLTQGWFEFRISFQQILRYSEIGYSQ